MKRFWDVKYKYKDELDLFYLEVRKRENSPLEIYIPWPTKYNISIDKIEKMQQALQNERYEFQGLICFFIMYFHPHTCISNKFISDRLIFVFKSEDSSSVLYTISAGLVKPATPEATKELKEREEKKCNLETEIRRNTSHLYELAKTIVHETKDQKSNSGPTAAVESSNTDSSLEIL